MKVAVFVFLALGSLAMAQSDDNEGFPRELQITDIHIPEECNKRVEDGDILTVEYTGWIDDSSETGKPGKKFDTSEGKNPFVFKIGEGSVISGWDQGLLGMCKGQVRELIIPPEHAYGDKGNKPYIPGGATLKMRIIVESIIEDDRNDVFSFIDTDNSKTLTHKEIDNFFEGRGIDTPKELWEIEDSDKDGFISWDEFTGPKGQNVDHTKEAGRGPAIESENEPEI